jgi:hypothetical protein
VLWIRTGGSGYRSGSRSGSRSTVLMTKNWEKFTAEKNYIVFLSKTAFYLSLGLHKGRPCYRRSLHPSKENIYHFITLIFFTFVGNFHGSGAGSALGIRSRKN